MVKHKGLNNLTQTWMHIMPDDTRRKSLKEKLAEKQHVQTKGGSSGKAGQADTKEAKAPTTKRERALAARRDRKRELSQLRKEWALYDAESRCYYVREKNHWHEFTETQMKRQLKMRGHNPESYMGTFLNAVDRELLRIQTEAYVAYAGELAGYPPGIHYVCGQRFLVTKGPTIPAAESGDWSTLGEFFTTLLGAEVEWFYGWMKCALASLAAGPPFRPGQALVLAGPVRCGKSLCQNLVTELLGNRSAKPWRYMSGATPFNGDLLQAEHLMIEDDVASTNMQARRAFGGMVKNMVVGETQSCHLKTVNAYTVTPFWRLSMSLNLETEDLLVLPPMDEGIADKFLMLKCARASFPYREDDLRGRREFRETLSAEMGAFHGYLRGWRLPKEMLDRSYGVRSFHNPDLLDTLSSMTGETKLLMLIDSCRIWDCDLNDWVGFAHELQGLLMKKDDSGQVKSLLAWDQACGSLLGKLARKYPKRFFVESRSCGTTKWRIKAPNAVGV